MSWRRWLINLVPIVLVVLVWLGGSQLERYQPDLRAWARLAILLLLTKGAADLLELPTRPKRSTFYYEDYFAEWVHFGILGFVAIGAFLLAGEIIGRELAVAPVSLGVYLIWRITSPHRGG